MGDEVRIKRKAKNPGAEMIHKAQVLGEGRK